MKTRNSLSVLPALSIIASTGIASTRATAAPRRANSSRHGRSRSTLCTPIASKRPISASGRRAGGTHERRAKGRRDRQNSSELEIVRHALKLALDGSMSFVNDLDEEDVALFEYCERVLNASTAGDMTEIRREIEEMAEDDGDDS